MPDRADKSEKILKTMSNVEEGLSVLAGKVFFYRNENNTLHQRIAYLEKEYELLKNKRDYTVTRLKELMKKFEEAGY